MSGIVGFVDENGAKPRLLEEMFSSILHEKSNRVEKYINDNIAVALVHPKVGNQIAFNEDRGLCVLFDGEIFDYGNKTESQAGFCLRSYEEKGEDFVKELNGQFIIVIIDMQRNKFLIFNDRMGTKPFYYYKGGGKLLFGSEIKAILQDKSLKREVNDGAVADFFAFGKVWGNKTLIKGIFVIPQASIIKMEKNRFRIRKYWDMDFKEDYTDSREYYIEKLVESLGKAIERRFSKDCHFTLSGGLDTRLILSLAGKRHRQLRVFSIGDDSHDEIKIAKRVAEKIGALHSIITIDKDLLPESIKMGVYISDGMSTCRYFGFFSVIDKLKMGRDIIISGSGLGELFGDYQFIGEIHFDSNKYEELAQHCFGNLNMIIKNDEMPLLFSGEYFKKIKGKAYNSVKGEIIEAKKHASLPANILYYTLYKNDLRRVIFCSEYTRFKLNARLPSTDIDFIDSILKIPPGLRMNRTLEYEIIKRNSPGLSSLPYNQTGFPVSYPLAFHKIGYKSGRNSTYKKFLEKIMKRDKDVIIPDRIEYIDLGNEIRKNPRLLKFFETMLLGKKSLSRPYFNSSYIKKIFIEHISGKKDNTDKLCALLTFELWHRLFIDEKS